MDIFFVLVYLYLLNFVYGSNYPFYTIGQSGLYMLLILFSIFIHSPSKVVVTPGEIVIDQAVAKASCNTEKIYNVNI